MTTTIRTESRNGKAVTIEAEKYSSVYHVRAYETISGVWYQIADNVQPDMKKAAAAFRRYVKEYL